MRIQAPQAALAIALLISCRSVFAHASEQGLVLLLPTNVYIVSGGCVILLTMLTLLRLPKSANITRSSYRVELTLAVPPLWRHTARLLASSLTLLLLITLLYLGIVGSRDPLQNPLPLYIWTVWWVLLILIHGVIGNIWAVINPWFCLFEPSATTLARARSSTVWLKPLPLPAAIESWPAVVLYGVFMAFFLAYPAPDDPYKLFLLVTAYCVFTGVAMRLFGYQLWQKSGECFYLMFQHYAQLSPIGYQYPKLSVGIPGWKLLRQPDSLSLATLALVMLACGSFDGINETFWWLALIDVNPLEFPGRSAIIKETLLGLAGCILLLLLVFSFCIALGMQLAKRGSNVAPEVDFNTLYARQALCLLPIVFAYHFAHYLTVLLVNAQYTLAATSDPLHNGADLLGLGQFYVTTGFLNTSHSVHFIWLSQAAAVVLGHVLSLWLAHKSALHLYQDARKARLSQLPLSLFMIFYTFLGLWLLAAPKGA